MHSSTKFLTHRNVIEKFFVEKDVKCIIVPDNLKLSEVMPNRLPKTKCLVLLKTVDALSNSNINHSVVSTELGGRTPFEQLELVSKSVLLPILRISNPDMDKADQEYSQTRSRDVDETRLAPKS